MMKQLSITTSLVGSLALAFPGAGHSTAARPIVAGKLVEANLELVLPENSTLGAAQVNQRDSLATFQGRILLSGTFTYGCTDACEKPFRRADMRLYLSPDARTSALLPRWKGMRAIDDIEIENSAKFVAVAVSRETMHQLEYGRLQHVTGRVSIVVDHFRTGVECDDTWASARFLSFAEPVSLDHERASGAGCD